MREALAATRAEDLPRHVLDDPGEAHPRLLRHDAGARGYLLRRRLRRRHHDGLRTRQKLAERDRDVTRAGGHVDHEDVELAPVHVREELLERPMEHRPAPHHRLVVVQEEADGHELQVVLHRRDDHLVHEHGLLMNAEDMRDRVAVHVRVEHADALADSSQRDREVRRQRRLADAALAAADGKHSGRRVERKTFGALLNRAAQLRRQRLALLRGHHVEAEGHAFHTANVAHDVCNLLLEGVAQRAARDGQRDRHAHVTAVDLDVTDHVELGHGALQLRVDHTLERTQDLVAVRLHPQG